MDLQLLAIRVFLQMRLRGQLFTLGVLNDDASAEEHAPALSTAREVPKAQAEVRRPPLSALVADPRDAAGIAHAYLEHRYTQQEIADHLGVHYSTISRRVRAVSPLRARNLVRDYGPDPVIMTRV